GQYGQPRIDWKAKGRVGIMRQKHCHLTVGLKEVELQPGQKFIGKWARKWNTEATAEFRRNLAEAAQMRQRNPHYITQAQVKNWPAYRDKVLLPRLKLEAEQNKS